MKAMILAAGLGTRLLPLTNTLPKPLLPIGNYPLIYYSLFMLRHYGITQVVINLHHKGEMIRKRLEADHALGMNIIKKLTLQMTVLVKLSIDCTQLIEQL